MGRRVGFTRRTRRRPRTDAPVAPGKPLVVCPTCGKGPIREGARCGWCGWRGRPKGGVQPTPPLEGA